jgi:hypothetical protein
MLGPAALMGSVAVLRDQPLQAHITGGEEIKADFAVPEGVDAQALGPARQQEGACD